jgi:CheY-like chemotaxis protein
VPARVLVVEDNVDAARLLEILLRTRAHPVSVAHDGRTALRLAREDLPHVMLIDIGLPDFSGYELARLIRADETLRAIRLIALTGYGEAAARAMTAASGFDHHLVKPLDRAELERLLQHLATPVSGSPGAFQPNIGVAGEA